MSAASFLSQVSEGASQSPCPVYEFKDWPDSINGVEKKAQATLLPAEAGETQRALFCKAWASEEEVLYGFLL